MLKKYFTKRIFDYRFIDAPDKKVGVRLRALSTNTNHFGSHGMHVWMLHGVRMSVTIEWIHSDYRLTSIFSSSFFLRCSKKIVLHIFSLVEIAIYQELGATNHSFHHTDKQCDTHRSSLANLSISTSILVFYWYTYFRRHCYDTIIAKYKPISNFLKFNI